MSKHYCRSSTVVALAIVASTSAFAGEGNVLRVIQSNPYGAVEGNSLFVDQTNANFSTVTGPAPGVATQILQQVETAPGSLVELPSSATDSSLSALQTGSGNSASITLSGNGGELQLLQDNFSSSPPTQLGNVATVNAASQALGAVIQIGDQNLATVDLSAAARGAVVQNGIGNTGSLIVGQGGAGQLVQNGNGNDYPVQVQPNTTVTVTQNGNGLQPVGVQGVQVFSTNPGTISITQTGF